MDKAERVRKYGEVSTPQWMVEKMCDELPEDAFLPEKTFLDPATGEGIFVLEVLRRKFANCKSKAEFQTALRSVYAMEIQEDNVHKTIENITELCRAYFKPNKDDLAAIEDHVILCDSLKVMRLLDWWNTDMGRTINVLAVQR